MINIDINHEKPLFIVGPKRSGTTLVRKVFNAHSKITIPPPSSLYRFFRSDVYTYGDLNDDKNILELIEDCLNSPSVKAHWGFKVTPNEILTLLPEKSFRGIFITLFHLYCKKFGTTIWGEKVPTNVFWLKEIIEDFPQARLLFIYRDGRDASVDQAELSWGPMNIYTASLAWQSHVNAMLEAKKFLKPGSYYELFYEKFVNDPERFTKDACHHLDIEYEPGMLLYYKQEPEEYMKNASFHQKTTQPITTDYVGIYKKLSLSDRQLQATLLFDTLQALGYEVEDEKREIDFWEKEHYLEDDRNGAYYVAAIEYKNLLKKKKLERKSKGVY